MAAHQAPLSLGFSRQEHWSGLPFPSPMTNLDSILKRRDITLLTKVCMVKAMVFPVVIDRCESWTRKKVECQSFWTVVLEKTFENPLDRKEIKPVNLKGNQSWIFIGRLMLKLKLQYFGPWCKEPDSLAKALLLGKTEGRSRLRATEEMVASSTQWTWVWGNLGNSEGQGIPSRCNSCGGNKSDMTQRLNNNLVRATSWHI